MKKLYPILVLSIVATSIPLILLVSTLSTEVWSDVGLYTTSDHANVTLSQPNPLLGNKYVVIAGGSFVRYEGMVYVNVTIMNKDTKVNQTRSFTIDATSSYVEVSFGSAEFTLEPGSYTIFYESNIINLGYAMYTKGWLCNPNNPLIPENLPNPNDIQYILIIVCACVLAGLGLYLGYNILFRRKEN
ncbi:MAG: hypothetical protein EAX96_04155 [Candidatus Lokiarchaeota archaeon]|nr:hypothetical protein [Candidatus Lokiarchaeota archaeon]